MARALVILAGILLAASLRVDAGSICPTYWTEFNGNCYRDIDRSTSGVRLWIGINDIAEEGEFVWSDGSNASYQNWRPNQPDNYRGQEDCVQIGLAHVSRNEWNDIDCNSDTIRHFICKGPARILDP
ncbi:alpha-N-acetylgalactosamine-specific lectin-like [Diadema setosum]|uniref:alpha-N-acetylgalactosamine-specific lectin-like n=1 Tax=Diadema setosum TaxID=31175 RepID=UPI003B3B10EE